VNLLDLGMDLPLALSHPRFHHQYLPDALFVEEISPLARLPEGSMKGVAIIARHHIGVVNAIAWSEKEKAYVGVSDPRARASTAWLRLREEGSRRKSEIAHHPESAARETVRR